MAALPDDAYDQRLSPICTALYAWLRLPQPISDRV